MTDEASWYKDAIIYELRVRSFFDSDDDGVGDLVGLTERLDYLQDLGVTALWLLPLYPSPLRDDGYDIADYDTVHAAVGTLDHFQRLLDAAHQRGLKVITELVLNHTSDQHPWFQRARRARPGSVERDFYVWSDDPLKWREARIIFQDFETSNFTWDPLAKAYYWHRFFSHQPDLNFDNPAVREAMFAVVDRWFSMGVDGMRLDAVPYLFEREGTTCENLPETHGFLKELRAHVDRKFDNKMLLAEANQWPEDAVSYFGRGDECHMAFHFPIMPRLFMALQMEDSYPIADILEQTPAIPDGCQWAIFLRNHDELTLEMVTDEERDYMVQRYASDLQTRINLGIRRRLAPLLQNDRRRIELMNVLLLSLPGTPVIYYGDEIGMGDNAYLGDRNGVRTPMQWSPDRNGGFSRANPHQLILPTILDPEYHYETVNVEVQQRNTSSLLWWMKRAIAHRKHYAAFGRGTLHLLAPENRKVLAFLRRYGDETLLVVVNLSRFPQWVKLDLSEFEGVEPRELVGNVPFPAVAKGPYLLTLGGHDALWFDLRRQNAKQTTAVDQAFAASAAVYDGALSGLLQRGSELEPLLIKYLPTRRWFRSKSRRIARASVVDSVRLTPSGSDFYLVLVEVAFSDGDPEMYVLPIRIVSQSDEPKCALLALRRSNEDAPHAWVCDATAEGEVGAALQDLTLEQGRLAATNHALVGFRAAEPSAPEPAGGAPSAPSLAARALGVEQSNTSYALGSRYMGKLLRQVQEGRSVEVEMLEHLNRVERRPNVPELVGGVELSTTRGRTSTLFVMQRYVPNEGDAWQLAIDQAQDFFERVLVSRFAADPPPRMDPLSLSFAPLPDIAQELLPDFVPLSRLLGQRTGELHLALSESRDNSDFEPTPFTALSKRSFYQSLRNLCARTLDKLSSAALPADLASLRQQLLARKGDIRARLDQVLARKLDGSTIRVHGDYHLGQVLYTGRDFFIIDFEGEPARSRAERRRKRSPMADVAGMLRSLHYAALGALRLDVPGSLVREEDRALLTPWAELFYAWVGAQFLSSYLSTIAASQLLPEVEAELRLLLEVHLLEKALYELGYELDSRPRWAELPLRGLLNLLG
jgi:maltose alpha-D-glucosyltransferase/alpha-amylase